MKIERLARIAALMLFIAGNSGNAEAKEIPIKGTFSGSSFTVDMAGNGDVGLFTGGTKGSPGSSTIQTFYSFSLTGPSTCLNGNDGFAFALVPDVGYSVRRLDSTGDLIFGKATAATICYDPLTNIQFLSATETITGGTGRFANATGSQESVGTAMGLFLDPVSGRGFLHASGKLTGTIILP